MARGRPFRLPDPLEKRHWLASDTIAREQVLAAARAYLEADLLNDAANFFEKAGDVEGLEAVKRRAIELGNAQVLSFELGRSRHVQVSAEEWRQAAENALRDGKFAYAALAFRKAGAPDRAQEAARQVPGARPAEENPSAR